MFIEATGITNLEGDRPNRGDTARSRAVELNHAPQFAKHHIITVYITNANQRKYKEYSDASSMYIYKYGCLRLECVCFYHYIMATPW